MVARDILNEELFGTPESSKSPGRKMPGRTNWLKVLELFSVFGAGGKKWARKALGGLLFGGGGVL